MARQFSLGSTCTTGSYAIKAVLNTACYLVVDSFLRILTRLLVQILYIRPTFTDMTWTSEQDFIDSYNHKLSCTFSHPSLPFVHHSKNWSACSRIVSLPAVPNALALSPDEALLAVTVGSDVLIYSTEDGMRLTHTLKGHTGWVSQVEWLPGKERKLVSSSTIMGMHDEEIVRFWDLNKEDSLTHVEINTREAAMGDISGAEPFVLQAGWTDNKVAASEPVFGEKMIEKHISAQVFPHQRLFN